MHNGSDIGSGGAYLSYFSEATGNFVNCLFDGNKALGTGDDGGGAILVYYGDISLVNTTMVNNITSTQGGAISIYTDSSSVDLKNCILWNNVAASDSIIFNGPNSLVTTSYSLIQSDTCLTNVTCGTGMIYNESPKFVNADSLDFRLLPCSPAIEVGNNASNISSQDINGNPRIFNATGLVDSIIDMGAYEMPTDNTLPTIWTGLGDGVLWSDALNWDDEFVPQPCRDIIIPSGTVTVPAGYEAQGKTLDVLIGAEMITEPAGVMDIKEN